MRGTKGLLLALALLLPIASFTARPAEASASVSLSFFYDSLAPYGNWYASADFGYVWRPAHVSIGWRPYVDGRWVHSSYGWTFVSYDPWGWGPYHYGRWYLDPYYGWVWVPGYEWAPAWVSFYEGPGWIGWAPLPPRVSLSVVVGGAYRIDPRSYVFVESHHFLDSHVGRRVQPVSRNSVLVKSARHVSRFDRVGTAVVNRGLSVDRIEKVTRQSVRTLRFEDQPDVRRASKGEVRRDSVSLFRPKVENRKEHPPKVTSGRPARMPAQDERASVSDERRGNAPVAKWQPARKESASAKDRDGKSTGKKRPPSSKKPPHLG
jgi:hypothetical protein